MSYNACSQHQNNEPAPRQVLGLVKKTWKLEQLRQILALYNVQFCKRGTKDDLLRLLERLSNERGLTREDRRRLLRVPTTRASRPYNHTRRAVAVIVPQPRPLPSAPMLTAARVTSRMRSQHAVEPQPNVAIERQTEPQRRAESESEPEVNTEGDVDVVEGAEIVCSICTETCSNDQIPPRRVTAGCRHDRDICLACLRRSISAQLDVKRWHELSCPCCEQSLGHKDVKDFGDPMVFERYAPLSIPFVILHPREPLSRHPTQFANAVLDMTTSAWRSALLIRIIDSRLASNLAANSDSCASLKIATWCAIPAAGKHVYHVRSSGTPAFRARKPDNLAHAFHGNVKPKIRGR